MVASSFSSLLLLFFLSQLLSTAFTSRQGFIDDPVIQQVVSPDSQDDLLASAELQFLAFKREYGKTYPTEEEEDYRFGVFMSNLRHARRNQINDPTAVHGVTKFSDLTPSEFRRKYFGSSPQTPVLPDNIKRAPTLSTAGLPKRLNWTEKGAVTPVKNQSECDGCWAFSTIAVIEGAHYLANQELVELSEQQLIACSKKCSKKRPGICNKGCHGGDRFLAFNYVNKSGVVKEEDYPFSLDRENDECEVQNKPISASIHNFSYIDEEEQYAAHLFRHGPIAVSIDLNLLQPLSYVGGVLCPKNKLLGDEVTHHAVALVGYDSGNTGAGEPFHWIVKNSYGKDWGEHGYFRVCKGVLIVSAKAIYAIAEKKTAGFRQIN